jgi:hypothetical protein
VNIKSLEFIIDMIIGTPLWVWGILAYLLFIGIRATRSRRTYPYKLLIIPAIFIALNYKTLTSSTDIIMFLAFLCIGAYIGFRLATKISIKIYKKLKYLEIPGSYATIITLLLFFSIKYIFGYMQVMQPIVAMRYEYIEAATSAVVSGFFIGKSFCYLYRFYTYTVDAIS